MIRHALDHADLANAAVAAFAVVQRIDAGLDKNAEDGLVGRNMKALAGIFQHHLERLVALQRSSRRKNLETQAPVHPGQCLGICDCRIDHRPGAAAIERFVMGQRRQQPLHVEESRGIVGVNDQLVPRQGLDLGQKGKVGAGAAGIEEPIGMAPRGQACGHRYYRGHADPAREQHDRPGAGLERKVVAGSARRNDIARLERVHVGRAALARLFQSHTQEIGTRLRRRRPIA